MTLEDDSFLLYNHQFIALFDSELKASIFSHLDEATLKQLMPKDVQMVFFKQTFNPLPASYTLSYINSEYLLMQNAHCFGLLNIKTLEIDIQ